MNELITLDFETYYDNEYTLKKMTTFEYITDPRFEVLAVSLKHASRPTVWLEEPQFRRFAERADWSKLAVLAHHTHYESLVLSRHYGVQRAGFWFDTLSMDRALRKTADHDLDSVAQHWANVPKGASIEWTKGKHRKDFTAEEWVEFRKYGTNDSDITYAAFLEMVRYFPRRELKVIDLIVRMYAEPQVLVDESILRPYAVYEKQRRADFLAGLGLGTPDQAKKILGSGDKFAALLREMGIEPPTKKTKSKKGWTYAFAKDDPFMQMMVEHEDEDLADLAQARLDTKSTLNVTRPQRYLALGAGGRKAPLYIVYSAAHTDRMGGGDKTNAQNHERIKDGKPYSGMIRHSLMAPPGKLVVVADSAQIEARMLAWLSEETKLVQAFADRRDVYSEQASVFYGRHVDRKLKLPDGSKPDEIPGFVGKVCVLGLGYGMGWVKLAFELLKGALGGKPVCFTNEDAERMGVNVNKFCASEWNAEKVRTIPTRRGFMEMMVHCAVCKHLVDTYRRANGGIPKLWGQADLIIAQMAAGIEGRVFRGTCYVKKNELVLPNGLSLQYPKLRRFKRENDTGWEYDTGQGWSTIYGGKFVENVDQALCRIIVVDQMVDYAMEGHPIWGTTHDEFASVSPIAEAERDLARMIEIMSTTPSWCPGLPLFAEGGIGSHYGDAK